VTVAPSGPLDGPLLDIVDGATTGAVPLVSALAFAVAAGALHGLGPGHGKSVAMGALVGAEARGTHAIRLALSVAAMHTFSVLVLAVGFVVLDLTEALERLTRALGVVAGLVVVATGAWLLVRRLAASRAHGGPGHHHDHLAPSGRGLLALAVSGGLVPSPTALLLLITGLLSGRSVVAVGLVVAYGLGLAVTVAAVGLAAINLGKRTRLARVPRPLAALARALPVLGAVGICLAGIVLVGISLA